MKHKTSFFAGMLTMLLIFSLAGTAVAASSFVKKDLYYGNITVTLDGKKLDLQGDREPFIIDGVTFLPVRAISEALGLDVDWDGSTNTVVLSAQESITPTLQQTIPTIPKEVQQAERRNPYKDLADWVVKSDLSSASTTSAVYMERIDSSSAIGIMYDPNAENYTLVMDSTISGSRFQLFLTFNEKQSWSFTTYSAYKNPNDASPYITSSDVIALSKFKSGMKYSFANPSGNLADLSVHEDAAASCCVMCVDFLNHILSDNMHTQYTPADFGFTSYK